MSDTVRYDDQTPRLFFLAAILWAVVAMLVGVLVAAMLFMPGLNLAPYLTFGRLRPLHTNAVIFAFVGQHDLRRRLLLDAAPAEGAHVRATRCRKIHFWGWQLIIVAAARHAAARASPRARSTPS